MPGQPGKTGKPGRAAVVLDASVVNGYGARLAEQPITNTLIAVTWAYTHSVK